MAFEPFFSVAMESQIETPSVSLDALRTGLALQIYAWCFSENRSPFSGHAAMRLLQLAHRPTSPISTELPAGSRT